MNRTQKHKSEAVASVSRLCGGFTKDRRDSNAEREIPRAALQVRRYTCRAERRTGSRGHRAGRDEIGGGLVRPVRFAEPVAFVRDRESPIRLSGDLEVIRFAIVLGRRWRLLSLGRRRPCTDRQCAELGAARLVVANLNNPLTSLLRLNSRFELVYEDKVAVIFVARSQPQGQEAVNSR